MQRKSPVGSFVPWETSFVTENAASFKEPGDLSFLPCHIQEATWMAGKQTVHGRWINTNPGPWILCQKGGVIDYPQSSSVPPKDNRKKHEDMQELTKAPLIIDKNGSKAVKRERLRVHRSRLEYDVSRLQKKLQDELDLHSALENGHHHAIGVLSALPSHLPMNAQKLLLDVATIEFAVSKLEQQIISLHWQLVHERSERENGRPSLQHDRDFSASNTSLDDPSLTCHIRPSTEPVSDHSCSLSPSSRSSSYLRPLRSGQPSSPATPTPDDVSRGHSEQSPSIDLETPNNEGRPTDPATCVQHYSSEDGFTEESLEFECHRQSNVSSEEESDWQSRSDEQACLSFEEWESRNGPGDSDHCKLQRTERPSPASAPQNALKLLGTSLASNELRQWPNKLSEQMVHCMMDIYHHISDHAAAKPSPLLDIPSPTSPFGHLGSSSLSSVSESSLLSFARSPLVDLRTKGGVKGSENIFDPYRTGEKLLWPEIGAYSLAYEVCWMSVGKQQLDYAAEALHRFKFLVEQLSKVDPSMLTHVEKLAFWINVYNALMMHVFLAYGTPKSEAKYLSLMQKANYTIGGHSFNAISIEDAFLKVRPSMHRPQLALFLALKKMKVSDQQMKFAVTYAEPLTVFALSFGAWSCPAVRVYTAEKVHDQLEASLHDYLRASVGLSNRGKLLVPKLLYLHARETVGDASIYDWICERLSSSQLAFVQDCMQPRRHRYLGSQNFAVLPFDYRFRYLFLSNARAAA